MKKELCYTVFSVIVLTSCNGANHSETRSENVHMQPTPVASHFVKEMYDVVKPLEVKKVSVKKDAKAEHKQVVHKVIKENKNNNRGYVAELTVEATAYYLSASETGKSPDDPEFGLTANGSKAIPGYTVAMSRDIPFNTIVQLPDGSIRKVSDRGGAITDGRMDVLLSSRSEADRFGRKKSFKIRVLKWGNNKTYFNK